MGQFTERMIRMNVLNATVNHTVFGTGKITQQDGNILSVTFPKPYGKKKFLYPNAFVKHLTLCDASLLPAMEKELLAHRMQIVEEQDRQDRAERIARFRAESTAKAKKKPCAKAKK